MYYKLIPETYHDEFDERAGIFEFEQRCDKATAELLAYEYLKTKWGF